MMLKTLHQRDVIDILYVSRKEGRRGLASIEYSIDTTTQRLPKKSKERLITAIRNNTSVNRTKKQKKTNKKQTKLEQNWEEKQLYGYFKRQTSDISHEKTWTWQRKGNLNRETESLFIAT